MWLDRPYSDVRKEQEGQDKKERARERLQKASAEQQQALRHLPERQRRGEEDLPLLELLQAVGVVPVTVRRKRELEGEQLTRYKALGRLLKEQEGVVVASRVAGEGQGYCLRYAISAAGAEGLGRALDP